MLKFVVERVEEGKNFPLPTYATPQSSGLDLVAAIKKIEILKPKEIRLFKSGLKITIPDNFEGQIRPRSGIAMRYGITVLNSPGTIDSDYKGEIGIILINLSEIEFAVEPGMRIAQLVFSKVYKPSIIEGIVSSKNSKRKSKGFGSTGL